MSVVIGTTRGGRTWLAGDSRTSYGDYAIDHGEKQHSSGDGKIVLSFVGLSRLNHLIAGNKDALFETADAPAISDKLRALVTADEWEPCKEPGEPHDWDIGGLIAVPDGLWHVARDFTTSFVQPRDVVALGSGAAYALGAAKVLGANAPETLRLAVSAAIACSRNCGGPVWLRSVELGKPELREVSNA